MYAFTVAPGLDSHKSLPTLPWCRSEYFVEPIFGGMPVRIYVFQYCQLEVTCARRTDYFHKEICHSEEGNVHALLTVLRFHGSDDMVEVAVTSVRNNREHCY
jgi:hypothetical protein